MGTVAGGLGAVVKIATFLAKHTTSRQVDMGESNLSCSMAILIESKDILDEDEFTNLLKRYDRFVYHSLWFSGCVDHTVGW